MDVYGLKRHLLLSSQLLVALTILLVVGLVVGDHRLFTLINLGLSNYVLDFVCGYGSTFLFSGLSLASLIVLYVSDEGELRRRGRASGLVAVLSGVLSYCVGAMFKVIVGRPRPFETLPARVVGLLHTSTFSFPSTTTMLVFGFTLPILFYRPRLGISLFILASFVGFSVVYAGFHYPTDVIAGAFFSAVIALSTYQAKPRITLLLAKYGVG